VDEARKVIQRLERIEALQSSQAPAETLLGEVRQLLREGEAWLAAEQRAGAAGGAGAAAALEGCRTTLRDEEVVPGKAESAAL
jgi:hypothetical protein